MGDAALWTNILYGTAIASQGVGTVLQLSAAGNAREQAEEAAAAEQARFEEIQAENKKQQEKIDAEQQELEAETAAKEAETARLEGVANQSEQEKSKRSRQKNISQRSKGRSGTILTGPLGVEDELQSPGGKTLLGV